VIVKMPLSDLTPAKYNPRWMPRRSLNNLTKSIEQFGLVQPIVWNSRTKTVVGGHQRLSVLVKQGVPEALVVVVDLSPEQEVALNIALNSHTVRGVWDETAERFLSDIDGDLLEDLKASLGAYASEDDPIPQPKTEVAPGSEIDLGVHKLYVREYALEDATGSVIYSNLSGNTKDFPDTDRPSFVITDPDRIIRGELRYAPIINENTLRILCHTARKKRIYIDKARIQIAIDVLLHATKYGESVLDPLDNPDRPGDTLIACEKIGRQAIVFQPDTKMASVIVERYNENT
jgi:hypothetical protein